MNVIRFGKSLQMILIQLLIIRHENDGSNKF